MTAYCINDCYPELVIQGFLHNFAEQLTSRQLSYERRIIQKVSNFGIVNFENYKTMKNKRYIFVCIALLLCASLGAGNGSTGYSRGKNIVSIEVDLSLMNKYSKEYISPGFDAIDYYSQVSYRITRQDDDEIWIAPTSYYHDNYLSGNRLKIEPAIPHDGQRLIPCLDCFIVNNTNKTLNIEGLEICVNQSQPDNLPYIYIYTDADKPHNLMLANGGLGKWDKAELQYRILKDREEFDGTYNRSKVIQYFDKVLALDMYDELVSMGYDKKKPASFILYDDYWRFWTLEKGKEAFYPFSADGTATIYGQLKFKDSGLDVDFMGKIPIWYPKTVYGLIENRQDIDDVFDVTKLKTSGSNYTLKYPYYTSIKPHGREWITIRLECSQSSIHNFTIKALNTNKVTIQSKTINFHYLAPKSIME